MRIELKQLNPSLDDEFSITLSRREILTIKKMANRCGAYLSVLGSAATRLEDAISKIDKQQIFDDDMEKAFK